MRVYWAALPLSLFFFNDTATTEIYTLSLHDALPICEIAINYYLHYVRSNWKEPRPDNPDRKSTRLNSSHEWISYAVFCLKKKKNQWLILDTKKQAAKSLLVLCWSV